MNKVLFWDFDGTITYSNRLWSNSLFQTLEKHLPQNKITIEEIRRYTSNCCTWNNADRQYAKLTGKAWWTHMESQFVRLYQQTGLSETEAKRLAPFVKDELLSIKNFCLYEDAKEVLLWCKTQGFKNIMITNNYPEIGMVAEQLGVAKYFDEMVISAEVGMEKPEKEIYEYAFHLAGKPEHCYMIGDNPIADVKGANAVGIKAILVHRESAHSGAIAQLSQLTELIPLLQNNENKSKRKQLNKTTKKRVVF